MKCKNCGQETMENASFCPECGQKLENETVVETVETTESTETAESTEAVEAVEATETVESTGTVEATETAETGESKVSLLKKDDADKENTGSAGGFSIPTSTSSGSTGGISIPTSTSGAVGGSAVPSGTASAIPSGTSSAAKSKKPPIGLFAGIGAVVVLLILCVTVFGNSIGMMFASPKDVYVKTEKKVIKEQVDKFAKFYDEYLEQLDKAYDQHVDASVKLSWSDEAKELYEEYSSSGYGGDTDLSWLDSIGLNYALDFDDDKMGADITFNINDKVILNPTLYMDMEKMIIDMPDFAEKALELQFDEDNQEVFDSIYRNKDLKETLPNSEDLKKVLNKYLPMYLEAVKEVKKTAEEIEVAGIKQKVNKYEAVFDDEKFVEVIKKMKEEMKKDKELERVVKAFYETSLLYSEGQGLGDELTADEAYDKFIENLDEELETEGFGGTSNIFIAGNKVVGREITALNPDTDEETFTLNYKIPTNGKKFGLLYEVVSEGSSFAVEGSGEMKGKAISGEFELINDDEKTADITLNTLEFKSGTDIKLNADIKPSVDSEMYGSSLIDINDSSFNVDLVSNQKEATLKVDFKYNDKNFATLVSEAKTSAKKEVKEPDVETVDMSDSSEQNEWIKDFDFDELVARLEDAGVPEELTGFISYFKQGSLY